MEEQNKELEEKNAEQQKHIDEIDTLLEKVRGIIIIIAFTQSNSHCKLCIFTQVLKIYVILVQTNRNI